MFYITAVRVESPGTSPEHITKVKWLNGDPGKAGETSTAKMVEFIDVKGNDVELGGPDGPSGVHVVKPAGRAPFLRTNPDDTPSDNLLALPRL